MPVNFVKFQRGSQAAYDRLKQANRIEEDALYFIYNDANDTSLGGLLYLGERLIGGSSAGNLVTSLDDLSDVDLSAIANVQSPDSPDGMILQYNAQSQEWQAVSIRTAIENSGAAIGGFISIDSGTVGQNQTVAQFLDTVNPNPNEGDIVFASGVPYIYDGSDWQVLTGTSLDSRVSGLEGRMTSAETQLAAVDGKISSAIANANHLTYVVPQSGQLPTITQENVGSLENQIFLIPNGQSSGSDRYSEYMLINGNFEKLGDWQANLNNYVTTTTFNTAIGSLQSDISDLQDDVSDLQSDVSALQAVVSNFDLSNYVTTTRFNNEVGAISALRTVTGDNTSTVIDELVDLRERLQWMPITSE